MLYFSRMIDKIRKHSKGELRDDFCENLGKGFDGRCADFLRVRYDDLLAEVAKGKADVELLTWCYETGRRLNDGDIFVWNQYITRVGWRDQTSEILERRKRESGLSHREDILTMIDYFDADEGRE